jgi:flagellar hook-length control protein FliK
MNAALLFGSSSVPLSVSSVSEKTSPENPQDAAFRQAFHTALQDKQGNASPAASSDPLVTPEKFATVQSLQHTASSAASSTPVDPAVSSDSESAAEEASVLSTEPESVAEDASSETPAETPPPASLPPAALSMAELSAELFRSTLQSDPEAESPSAEAAMPPLIADGAFAEGLTQVTDATSSTDAAGSAGSIEMPLFAGAEGVESQVETSTSEQMAAASEAAAESTLPFSAEALVQDEVQAEQAADPVVLSFSGAGLVLTSAQEQKTFQNQSLHSFSRSGAGSFGPGLAAQHLEVLPLVLVSDGDASAPGAAQTSLSAGVSLPANALSLAGVQEGGVLRSPDQLLSQLPTGAHEAMLSGASANGTSMTHAPGSAAALLSEAATQLETRFEVFKQVEQHLYLLRHHQQREIQIQLEPAQLGKLNLRLQQEGHLFQLHITAESAVAKEVLEAHIQQLKDQFAQQGFELESVNVNVQSETSGGFDSESSASRGMAAFAMPRAVAMPFSLLSGDTEGGASGLTYGSAASTYYYHQVNYFA